MALPNQPKILKSAFVEFGVSVPPLILVFQFNPLTVSRSRTAKPVTPSSRGASRASHNAGLAGTLLSGGAKSLVRFRNGQTISVQPETIGFDIRLDASDKLNEGNTLTEQFGIAPQLATLEQMMLPKSNTVVGGALGALLGSASKYICIESVQDPPVILWVWGRKKIVPVNILSMQIREEMFSADLNPTRAVVTVQLEVIEGPNVPYLYSKSMQEVMSLLNLANISDIKQTVVPR
jgi:hypothetical protein